MAVDVYPRLTVIGCADARMKRHWWRVNLRPLSPYKPRKYSRWDTTSSWNEGFAYFPRRFYPHKRNLPIKRVEIPIWPNLQR